MKILQKWRCLVLVLALPLSACAMSGGGTTEVYLNIPGQPAVHCINAEVISLQNCMVKIRMPWGVTYITHLSNVVMVERKGRKDV